MSGLLHPNLYKLAEPEFGKTLRILVWLNGDFYSNGHEILLNPKHHRTWNAILAFLTDTTNPSFGAIRKLIHLESNKVVLSFTELLPNAKYIAAGNEKLKLAKNGYLTAEERRNLPTRNFTNRMPRIKKTEELKAILDFIAYTKKKKRTIIYTMVNGRLNQKPCKIVLTASDFEDWHIILEYLSHRLDIPEGIKYICNVVGRVIQNPHELQHGELYIAVPFNRKFVKLGYVKLFFELMRERRGKGKIIHKIKGKTTKQTTPSILGFHPPSRVQTPDLRRYDKCLSHKCANRDCKEITAKVPRAYVNAMSQTMPEQNLVHIGSKTVVYNNADMQYGENDVLNQRVIVNTLLEEVVQDSFIQLEQDGLLSPEKSDKFSNVRCSLEIVELPYTDMVSIEHQSHLPEGSSGQKNISDQHPPYYADNESIELQNFLSEGSLNQQPYYGENEPMEPQNNTPENGLNKQNITGSVKPMTTFCEIARCRHLGAEISKSLQKYPRKSSLRTSDSLTFGIPKKSVGFVGPLIDSSQNDTTKATPDKKSLTSSELEDRLSRQQQCMNTTTVPVIDSLLLYKGYTRPTSAAKGINSLGNIEELNEEDCITNLESDDRKFHSIYHDFDNRKETALFNIGRSSPAATKKSIVNEESIYHQCCGVFFTHSLMNMLAKSALSDNVRSVLTLPHHNVKDIGVQVYVTKEAPRQPSFLWKCLFFLISAIIRL
ncbi:uncharacterized protein LOC132696966 isoform X2 [Cylas formicarius]|uniref:uncharacterized protein LOC132696966 isoform X2 n=1 Tax=Cylas formicarius TaxID=197179 RepID=UPI00295832F6|nr:uncharacterized protein LOC132696966 isoform X2 [Cylas formicarius]